jgi:hypothetical protein
MEEKWQKKKQVVEGGREAKGARKARESRGGEEAKVCRPQFRSAGPGRYYPKVPGAAPVLQTAQSTGTLAISSVADTAAAASSTTRARIAEQRMFLGDGSSAREKKIVKSGRGKDAEN